MDAPNRDPQAGALIRLRGSYPSLKSALQKVANVILQQPEMAVYASVNEVAAAAGVSEATVMRFCRILGFKGFQDFKIALAREMVTPSQFPQGDLKAEDDPATIVRKVLQAGVAALQDTMEVLEPKAVRQAAEALLKARQILVIGVGDSGPVATYAANRLFLMGLKAYGFADAYQMMQAAATSGREDVLVVVSRSGRCRELVETAHLAKKAGTRVIAVTNNALSPLSRTADLVLVAASREAGEQQDGLISFLCQAAVLDCLITLTLMTLPAEAKEKLAGISKIIPQV
jgi:DNA-binding MurR/RpiR family transcriptional regulator